MTSAIPIIDARSFAWSPVISMVELFSALERSLNQLIEAQAKWAHNMRELPVPKGEVLKSF